MAEAAEKVKEAEVEGSKELEAHRTTPRRMFSPFGDMEGQTDRLLESIFPRGWLRPFGWERPLLSEMEGWRPAVDVVDREDEFLVRAEIPGVDKEDLDVSMSDSTVTIKGKTHREEKEEKGDYYHCEISRGSFSRTVTLPAAVDTSKAEADYKDGLLMLKIPKREVTKRRRIKIK
ncbi:MAG: Hsp20 family protein [Gammaproteobacteria bacterium]|jgi:HSP20 family protein|nr:Hsp20 family protein [Gammaproteobacteria bacterium]